MKLKLKETPLEWTKFTLVCCAMAAVVLFVLLRKGVIVPSVACTVIVIVGLAGLAAVLKPRVVRGFYRVGMTFFFYIGQFMGKILLGILFCLLVVPMGLLLRIAGKDLLEIKRQPRATSYWKPARNNTDLSRQF